MKFFAVASTLFSVLLSIAGTAVAEPASDVRPSRHGNRKSPGGAALAALAPVIVGGALIGSALVVDDQDLQDGVLLAGAATLTVGPSLGHFYAGAPGRGIAALGARAGGVVLVSAALYAPDLTDDDGGKAIEALARFVVIAAGVQLVVGGAVFSVVDAAPAARRHNRDLGLVPVVVPAATGMAPGLAVAGRF